MRTERALAKQTIRTYAEVLFEAAAGEDAVFAVGEEFEHAAYVVRAHADLRETLTDADVPADSRRQIVEQVFADLKPAIVATLGVMAERGNIDVLSSVADEYGRVAEERLGTTIVDVTTAVSLNDALRDAIKVKVSADLGTDVMLREHIDPAIVGGIIMSAHGRRVDASVTAQLDRARSALSTAHSGGEA